MSQNSHRNRQIDHAIKHLECWDCMIPLEEANHILGYVCPGCKREYAKLILDGYIERIKKLESANSTD